MNKQTASVDFGGKKLEVEVGYLAKQASGTCKVTVGETVILATVAVGKEPKEGLDFTPLTVNYKEKTYAAGKIPGGFFKREGRPREKEILACRVIDRTIRPFFPENWRNDTQISLLVLSFDGENDSVVPCLTGISIALNSSNIPFPMPIAGVRIGKIDGKLVVNPELTKLKESSLDLVVGGTEKAISMVESGSNELSEKEMVEALMLAQEEIKKLCVFQQKFIGTLPVKEKYTSVQPEIDTALENKVKELSLSKTNEILTIHEKEERDNSWSAHKKDVLEKLASDYPEQESAIKYILEELFYTQARALVLDKKIRADGRGYDDIRNIECLTGVLPRTHGSAVFTRGQTQGLVTVTLGNPGDKQIMDELDGDYKERFMLHYNFPGFATGEARPDRGTSRRETGHGALARKALHPLLPKEEDFPYTLRVVSEILESNGSSSMATVCGGSLAFFDAGVPLKSSCAGIAMGMVKEGDKYAVLTDIMGMEDHLGDMDFKVAGTKDGITALQMDIKILGLTTEILSEALEKAKVARLSILEKMEAAIVSPRPELSAYAPRMVSLQINPSKIGALIGPGGKNIRAIQEQTGADINIEDDGKVFISSEDKEAVDEARRLVENCTADAEVGKVYKGKITRILNFGAFAEILPGKEGLIHISQLADRRVQKVEDVVKEGDEVDVKVVEIDNQGRINLSMKAVNEGK